MKRRMLCGLIVLAGCLFSQTSLPPGQVRAQPVIGVYVNITGRGLVLATLDPVTLTLDSGGTTPVLRVIPQASNPTINEKHVSLKPVVGTTMVMIPDTTYVPASLNVYFNGLLQSLNDDYTVSVSATGPVVTLLRATTAGDIVQLDYRF